MSGFGAPFLTLDADAGLGEIGARVSKELALLHERVDLLRGRDRDIERLAGIHRAASPPRRGDLTLILWPVRAFEGRAASSSTARSHAAPSP